MLLSEWVSFLLVAVPSRSHRTFAELVIGCMLSPEGWVIVFDLKMFLRGGIYAFD